MQTLVIVFLAIIALASLLQAGAAVAAAIAARKLGERFDELEDRFERELRPGLAKVSSMVGMAADISEQALGHAERIDGAVSSAADRVNAVVDRVARGVEDNVVGSIEKVEDHALRRVRKAVRPFARAAAIVEGVRRGVVVWRQGARRRSSEAAEPPHVA